MSETIGKLIPQAYRSLPLIDLSSFLPSKGNVCNEWEANVAAARFDNAMTSFGFAIIVGGLDAIYGGLVRGEGQVTH